MAKKPPACTHRTSMMPPMKLDMSNLAWENCGGVLVLPPSPERKDKEFDWFTEELHESRAGREKEQRVIFF